MFGSSLAMDLRRLCQEASRRTGGSFTAWLPGPDGTPTFDPTGLVKGWAVEQAFKKLLQSLVLLGEHDALMSAGGDVVACARTDTPDWVVAIKDARDRNQVLRTIPLRHGAVTTSGTAAAAGTGAVTAVAVQQTLLSPRPTRQRSQLPIP